MQKKKPLFLIPVFALLLSGCSLADIKSFVKDNLYHPVVGFFSSKNEVEQGNEQSPKTYEPEEYINPNPKPVESEEQPKPEEPENQEQPGNSDKPEQPEEPAILEPVYDEAPDSVEGIDVLDMSGLYNSISSVNENYTATIKGYFNEVGGYDYYRHYQKNYVCDKTSYYTENIQYTLPDLDIYLPVCNTGYFNKNNNYYSFSLKGETKEERLASSLTNDDLIDEVEGRRYQDDLFSVADLNQTYFEEKGFTRISSNKYQCTDRYVCEEFIPICSPDLINEGYYLTFSRVTIETNPDSDNALRIRLYVSPTQIGKMIDSHRDEETKPNWYLLFSEAYISNVDTTTFAPASSLLSE